MSRLVLIDRDGTINVEKHYLSSPDQIELLPHAAEGINRLRNLGLRVVVVTNQSGVGRGLFGLEKLEEIHERLREVLKDRGTSVDAIYFCPHLPDDKCRCRKPLTEMAARAAREFDAALSESFVIGDKPADIAFGKNIGAVTILIRTGYGKETERDGQAEPDYILDNLYEAAGRIKEIMELESFDK